GGAAARDRDRRAERHRSEHAAARARDAVHLVRGLLRVRLHPAGGALRRHRCDGVAPGGHRLDHDARDDARDDPVLRHGVPQRQPGGGDGHVVRAVLGPDRHAPAPVPRRRAVVGAAALARDPAGDVRGRDRARRPHLRELPPAARAAREARRSPQGLNSAAVSALRARRSASGAPKPQQNGWVTLHDTTFRGFASDNYAGIHPEVLQAISDANGGHQISYGEDVYTARLGELIRAEFGERAEVFPVFNGTGANVVSLTALLPRWGSVVTTSTAHIHTDEGGAPEKVAGLKLFVVPTPDGKLSPELLATEAWGMDDEHRSEPAAVSITQTTE